MDSIGSVSGIGAPISPNQTGGDTFARHIGDRLLIDFHEGAGTTVRDLSTNGNDGTFKASGEPAWERGRVNFDGADDYIDCGNASSLDVTAVTIEVHAKHGNAAAEGICGKRTEGGDAAYSLWSQTGNVGSIEIYIGNARKSNESATALGVASFQNVIGAYDNQNLKVYLNGAEDGTEAQVGNIDVVTDSVRVGWVYSDTYAWQGRISFVRINAIAFSAPQALQEYLWNKWRN